MATVQITLRGCAPIPLAHYLKALGLLRLVSEQRDREARGHWEKDAFVLTSTLDETALTEFLLREYRPTPVIAPWNGGSGFYYREGKTREKDPITGKLKKTGVRDQPTEATRVADVFASSHATRFTASRLAVSSSRACVANLKLTEAPKGEPKRVLIESLRAELEDWAVDWLDTVIALTSDSVEYPPLLGTGGTDGNLDFTTNFMQRLVELFDVVSGAPVPGSPELLRIALFGGARSARASKAPAGQFFPGAAGGANATAGFAAESAVNPWDFVLMIEGALLFAAATVKRLESLAPGVLVYPFCVRQAGAGYGSASLADEKDARCEMWLPLWSQPTSLAELRAVFGEGRAQVNGRPARQGVDFARAVATLGVDRGIEAFQRYGFQVRNGLSYFATPLERMPVRRNASVDLLSEADEWLDEFRRAATSDGAPASVQRSLRLLEEAILALCRDHRNSARVLQVLVALGTAERALASSLRWTFKARLRPLGGLNREQWLGELEGQLTQTVEAQLAASLASITGNLRAGSQPLPFRSHLESAVITRRKGQVQTWFEERPSPEVVWKNGALPDVLNAVFTRRLIGAQSVGAAGGFDRGRPVSLYALTEFVEHRTDDLLIADLTWGFSLLDWESRSLEHAPSTFGLDESGEPPSAFYALLKLCFSPSLPGKLSTPVVPSIHRHAAAGHGEEAARLAARRLRASGFSLPDEGASPVFPIDDVAACELGRSVPHIAVKRTAAALLFPLTASQLGSLRSAKRSFQFNSTTIP